MNYLSHRFSNLTSLIMLLILSLGTAWMFSFAVRINEKIDSLSGFAFAVRDEEVISEMYSKTKGE